MNIETYTLIFIYESSRQYVMDVEKLCGHIKKFIKVKNCEYQKIMNVKNLWMLKIYKILKNYEH